MTIGIAEKKDIPELYKLECSCFSTPWSAAQLDEELNIPDGFFALCRDGENIVGYIIMRMAGDQGELFRIAAAAGYRRMGIGESLLKEGLKWLSEKNAESAFLEVRVGNTPAVGLYEKLGFEKLGIRKNYYTHPTEDALIMVRKVI
jgi:[ribosomal protein S18]-alanine N-acetyltransferase